MVDEEPVADGAGSPALTSTELERYSRHIIMEEIGPTGQASLLNSSVLVVGAGGLGSPAIQYLAAAGIGTLGIADDDTVERSNLHRQIVHGEEDIGRRKVESAIDFVRGLNPDIEVEVHGTRLTPENVHDVVDGYDLIVDAADNFRTRYLLNDVARLRPEPVPVVHGAIYKFEGQATTLVPGGPCYRCLFPRAPKPGEVPDCATTGVLGVLPGIVGGIQATEVVKLVLGLGEPLRGRLLFYNALETSFETVTYDSRGDCPVCGNDPVDSIEAIAYRDQCRVSVES